MTKKASDDDIGHRLNWSIHDTQQVIINEPDLQIDNLCALLTDGKSYWKERSLLRSKWKTIAKKYQVNECEIARNFVRYHSEFEPQIAIFDHCRSVERHTRIYAMVLSAYCDGIEARIDSAYGKAADEIAKMFMTGISSKWVASGDYFYRHYGKKLNQLLSNYWHLRKLETPEIEMPNI